MSKIAVTGGREETVMVEFVPSNYHNKNPGEKLVTIEGAVSSKTLKEIISMLDQENLRGLLTEERMDQEKLRSLLKEDRKEKFGS